MCPSHLSARETGLIQEDVIGADEPQLRPTRVIRVKRQGGQHCSKSEGKHWQTSLHTGLCLNRLSVRAHNNEHYWLFGGAKTELNHSPLILRNS